MAQVTNNLKKEKLRQVIFMDCSTFKLSHHKKGFSSNSPQEIFDFGHQDSRKSTATKAS